MNWRRCVGTGRHLLGNGAGGAVGRNFTPGFFGVHVHEDGEIIIILTMPKMVDDIVNV